MVRLECCKRASKAAWKWFDKHIREDEIDWVLAMEEANRIIESNPNVEKYITEYIVILSQELGRKEGR